MTRDTCRTRAGFQARVARAPSRATVVRSAVEARVRVEAAPRTEERPRVAIPDFPVAAPASAMAVVVASRGSAWRQVASAWVSVGARATQAHAGPAADWAYPVAGRTRARDRVRRQRPNATPGSVPSAATWGRPAAPARAAVRAPVPELESCATTTSALPAGCRARPAAQVTSVPVPRAAPATCASAKTPLAVQLQAPARPAAAPAAAPPVRPAARRTSATTGSLARMGRALPAGTPVNPVAPQAVRPQVG